MKLKNLMILLFIAVQFIALNIQAQEQEQEKVYRATIDSDGVQKVEIVGGSYYYDPNYIIVKVNVPVELSFKKARGYIPHNIIIKAPEAGIDIKEDMENELKTITFTPVKTGIYPIYCDKRFLFFPTHREKGMEGVLEVTE